MYTEAGKGLRYEVFAVTEFDDRLILGSEDFSDPAKLKDLIAEMQQSAGERVRPVEEDDPDVLILSTCVGVGSSRRFSCGRPARGANGHPVRNVNDAYPPERADSFVLGKKKAVPLCEKMHK